MDNGIPILKNIPDDSQIILFLLGPHWIKVPPLSLVYLDNYLSRNGFKATVIDLNMLLFRMLKVPKNQWLALNPKLENNIFYETKRQFPGFVNNLMNQVKNCKAKVLGFSLLSRNRKATFDFVNEILRVAPKKTFVFGGPEVLFEYHKETFFDEMKTDNAYFVLGEGETALLDICQNAYDTREAVCNIHKGKKLISYNEIARLDTLPYLDFDNIALESYSSKVLPLFSSRGCIRRCIFCSEYKLYKNFRQHSPEYMTALIKALIKKYKRYYFSFHDSLINANLKWLESFCELVIQENLQIQWEAQLAIRSDMKKALFDKMKAAGCYNLFIGLESASDKILASMNKGYNSIEAKEFFEKLSLARLQYEISIITGFPHESEDDFEKTLVFLKNNKQNIQKIAQINPFVEYSPAQINSQNSQSCKTALQKVERLLAMLKKEKIKHTRSFINNLIPS